jgi:hypothetical protein
LGPLRRRPLWITVAELDGLSTQHTLAGENLVRPLSRDGFVWLAAGAASVALARRLVRDCVADLGGDERLSYAAQLAVSEVVGSMLEHEQHPVALRWLAAPEGLEFVISGEADQRLRLGDLRRRLLATAADDIDVTYEQAATTVRLRFEL